MNDDSPQGQIDEAAGEADDELSELEGDAGEMENRLEQNEAIGEDVEVPEPERGEDLNISGSPDDTDEPVDEEGVPEDEGESAAEAGQ